MKAHAASLALLAALGAAACGREFGGDPHAAQTAFVPPDHAYRLWYPTPPWELVASSGTHATLRIAAGAATGDAAPRSVVALSVDEVPGATPSVVVAGALAQAVGAGGAVRTMLHAATFASDAPGVEASSEAAGVVSLFVATALADGRTVALTFTSGEPIDQSADIDAMVAAFEPRPPSP